MEMQTDLMRIQAIKFSISEIFGRLFSYCDSLSDEIKIAKAKAANEIRVEQSKEGLKSTVRMTVEDIKDLSCAKTADLWSQREELKMIADGIRGIYFALRDAGDILNKCMHRFWMDERDLAKES